MQKVSSGQSRKGVIITGAGRRLGRVMALFFAEKGYDVMAHYHTSRDGALSLQHIITTKLHRQCAIFQADLCNFASLKHLIEYSFKHMPYCSTLINNASVFYESDTKTCAENAFDENYKVHVKAPVFLTQYFAKMCAGNGLVINLVDTALDRTSTKYLAYLLSKRSLADFTKLAANELGPRIRINAIGPSHIPDHEICNIDTLQDIDSMPNLKNFIGIVNNLIDERSTNTGEVICMADD